MRRKVLLALWTLLALIAVSCSPADGLLSKVKPNVKIASLDSLDSYRAKWTVKTQMPDNTEMIVAYEVEWIREPPARHVVVGLGDDSLGEYIVVGGAIWVRVGDTWVKGEEEQETDTFDQLAEAVMPDRDMALIGKQAVNEIHCKHYVHDSEVGSKAMHRELWVADQSGMPPVPVRALYRLETKTAEGSTITKIDANFYDINAQIAIEPPQ